MKVAGKRGTEEQLSLLKRLVPLRKTASCLTLGQQAKLLEARATKDFSW